LLGHDHTPTVARSQRNAPAFPDVGTDYGVKVLEEECRQLTAAREPGRNKALFDAARRMGDLVLGGQLDRDYAWECLAEAAAQTGLDQYEIRSTLKRVLGTLRYSKPRAPKDRPLTPRRKLHPSGVPEEALRAFLGAGDFVATWELAKLLARLDPRDAQLDVLAAWDYVSTVASIPAAILLASAIRRGAG
jgi:hypothetical protein